MRKTCYFINPNPHLSIHRGDSKELGRCYYGGEYKIISSTKLNQEKIRQLWDMGFLGEGQSFTIKSTCDGTEKPSGFHEVPGVMMDDNGKKYSDPPVDWAGNPAKPALFAYYEYVTTWRCDSSD